MQEAVVAALRPWRIEGIPPNPGAWLTLAARRRAIDRLRRSVREEKAVDALTFADSRARLLAGGCRPGRRRPGESVAEATPPMSGFRCCSAAATRPCA